MTGIQMNKKELTEILMMISTWLKSFDPHDFYKIISAFWGITVVDDFHWFLIQFSTSVNTNLQRIFFEKSIVGLVKCN